MSFQVWKKFLKLRLGMTSNGRSTAHLGKWITNSQAAIQELPSYLNTEDNTLCIRVLEGFNIHKCIWEWNIILCFAKLRLDHQYNIPECAQPVDISIHQAWIRTKITRTRAVTKPCYHGTNKTKDTNPSQRWTQKILQKTIHHDISDMPTILNSKIKLYLASDGSLYAQHGGYALVLMTDSIN